ncbi:MAG: hypothetical protein OXE41_01370 [Gammaproteobacteria bacterium]|nr:hypothetical protein [Gammaproteobacteria bacterium]MCY4274041.1 hypothetical protein [Gammaproteobacteria bacterium]
MSKTKKVLKILLLAVFIASPLALFASGGGGSSGGGGNGDNSQGFFSNAYDKGKKIFMEQVVCESCPFANTELTTEGVNQIIPELERNGLIGSNLSYNQRYSVKYYVKKRFSNEI